MGPDIVEEGPSQNTPLTFILGEGTKVALRPYFSNKPFFVTVKEKTRLLNGLSVSFIVDLPPILKFEIPGNIALDQAMPFSLSSTWLGYDTTTGILCNSLPCSLIPITNTQIPEAAPGLIRCTINIKNHSKANLDLDHLLINPEQLNIYEHKGQLFSSILYLNVPGNNLKVDVHRANDPSWNLLTPSVKNDLGELIVQWGIDMIKNLTNI